MSEAEATLVEGANYVLLDECMQQFGLTYALGSVDWSTEAPFPDRRYGLWGQENAAQFGYALPARSSDDAFAAVSEASEDETYYDRAFECIAAVDDLPVLRHSYAGGEEADALMETAARGVAEAQQYARDSDEWDPVIGAWHDCLESKGVVPPTEEGSWTPVFPTEDKQAEINVATIDVSCKADLDMVQKLANIEAQYQEAFIEANETSLAELADVKDQTLSRAREIVSYGG